jgi:hypothetical protein
VGGQKHEEDAAEAAKAGASMALANNTKVIGPQVHRGGKVIVYSRPYGKQPISILCGSMSRAAARATAAASTRPIGVYARSSICGLRYSLCRHLFILSDEMTPLIC